MRVSFIYTRCFVGLSLSFILVLIAAFDCIAITNRVFQNLVGVLRGPLLFQFKKVYTEIQILQHLCYN